MQRSLLELKRMQDIVFSHADKENSLRKGINASTNADEKLPAWERYEKKTKNLKENYKRLTDKCKNALKPLAQLPQDTLPIENKNDTTLTFSKALHKLARNINSLLADNERDKLQDATKLADKALKELMAIKSMQGNSYDEVANAFSEELVILERLVQGKVASAGEMKGIAEELGGSSIKKLHGVLLEARASAATSLLNKINLRIGRMNRKRAFEIMRSREQAMKSMNDAISQKFILKKLLIHTVKSYEAALLRAFNMWRLHNIKHADSLSIPKLYDQIIAALNSPSPWIMLHRIVEQTLASQLKGVICTELVQYDKGTHKLFLPSPEPNVLQEAPVLNSISGSVLSSESSAAEVSNILEDKRFSHNTDFPRSKFAMKIFNLSMLCIAITSGSEEKIGLLRVYKSPGKHMFGAKCRWLAKLLAKLVGHAMGEFEKATGKAELSKNKAHEMTEELKKNIDLELRVCNALIDIQTKQHEKEICEAFVLSVMPKCDNAILIPSGDNKPCHASALMRVCKDVAPKEFSKDDRQVLCIPIECNAGVVQVERLVRGRRIERKLRDEAGDKVIEAVKDVATVALNKLEMTKEFNQTQRQLEDKVEGIKKTRGATQLFNAVERKLQSNLRAGLYLTSSRIVLQYPNLRVTVFNP